MNSPLLPVKRAFWPFLRPRGRKKFDGGEKMGDAGRTYFRKIEMGKGKPIFIEFFDRRSSLISSQEVTVSSPPLLWSLLNLFST
jgi:hypothetical protein